MGGMILHQIEVPMINSVKLVVESEHYYRKDQSIRKKSGVPTSTYSVLVLVSGVRKLIKLI